jgi:DNA-binding transcriptional LysR family regulator
VVRIAVFQSAALSLMAHALTTLRTEHPQLTVTMTQREPETALYETSARDFDLVVAEQYPGHAAPRFPELDRRALTRDALRLAVGTEYSAGRRCAEIEDLAGAVWVMEPGGTASRHWAEQQCRRAGFEPDVRFETADLQAQVRLIQSGNAVGILPDLLWGGGRPSVHLLELPGSPRREIFTSARAATVGRPALLACRQALADAAARLTPDA